VKQLATAGPRLITYNLEKVKRANYNVKGEMGFKHEELVSLLLSRPRIWMEGKYFCFAFFAMCT